MKIDVRYIDYQKQMLRKIKALGKGKIKSTSKLAELHTYESQRRAAVKSGKTRSGIRFMKIKNGHRVISTVPGSFKQNLFQNQSEPYKVLRFRAAGGGKFYAPNQTVRYGDTALSRNNNQIIWTGVPGFFSIGRNISFDKAEDVYVSQVQIALNK